jgi:hypothetical protein
MSLEFVAVPPTLGITGRTGDRIRVLTGSGCGFQFPAGIADDGTHVWVANEFGDSVREIDASTEALVEVPTGRPLRLRLPGRYRHRCHERPGRKRCREFGYPERQRQAS